MKFGVVFVNKIQVISNIITKINQDIKFVDVQKWKVYEHYDINNQKIMNQIGFFDSLFHYVSITTKSLEERRGNFQGYHMKAITEQVPPFITIDISNSTKDEKSATYDVTETVEGMYYEAFHEMQTMLNFSATIYKRTDGKWGPTVILENGTILSDGMVQSITSGFAEIIVTA